MIHHAKNKKIAGKIVSWILGTMITIMLIFEGYGLISASSNYGVPDFFGYQMLVIQTDSMDLGPDTFPVDMGIIVQKVDPATLQASTAVENHDGDVITFFRRSDGRVVTHRIIGISANDQGLVFRCLGDNLMAETCPESGCTLSNSDYVAEADVLGKVVAKSLPLGKAYRFLSNPVAMLLLVLLPLGVLVILSSIDFVKALKTKEEKPTAVTNLTVDEINEIKEAARKAILDELQKQKGDDTSHE